ncbi:unnamed protein product [Fusarium venenatum]|uniref:Uncharacterized protein n=1 Tax=Fusarium venenatum TaxID=56646 RepID=A0A2L2T982_9HYPO|nr:uncharacterized protein FVRRES_03966 [Fusarium venenatum]CEI67454.1 unnamed protein product [Fusarium venenatum]
MSNRIEKLQGGRNPIHLRGNDPKLDTTTTPPRRVCTCVTPSGSSSFNPEAAPFTPTAPTAFVNTPDSSPADPQSIEKSPEERRAQRLREIKSIEDERDRENAMNDFIWEMHTEWSAKDLAKEKEEKELEERRQKFGRHDEDFPNK